MLRKVCILVMTALIVSAVNATLISHHEIEGTSWGNSVEGSKFPSLSAQGGATFASDPDRGTVASLISTRWLQGGNATGQFDDLSTEITIALWVKSSQVNPYANRRIIGRRDSWGIDVADGSKASFFVDGVSNLTGTSEINDGKWHHIAVTWDTVSGDRKLYVDGLLDAEDTAGALEDYDWGWGHFAIGARATAFSTADTIYRGYVDDVRIYNSVLSGSEIMTIVPEPATLGLLAFGAIGLIRRRK